MNRLGLLLLVPAVVGCGAAKSKVSGRVLLNGTPLPGGLVTFQPANPKYNTVTARLDEQGNYEAVLPVGEVKVSVDNRELAPRGPRVTGVPQDLPPAVRQALKNAKPTPAAPPADNAPAKSSRKYVPISSKYYDIETSGLRFKVEGSNQKQDIELKNDP